MVGKHVAHSDPVKYGR